jgi:DNA-binding transcriptional ArsR family regulator
MSESSVPKWLAELGVKSGDWYINPKARARRLMLNSLSAEARRVYACLELATMGFQQELAVTMENGKRRPLTPGDVARQTELHKVNVSRAFGELEDAGLAKREADDGESLRRGHVRLYSWAVPHPTAPNIKEVIARDNNSLPDWIDSRPDDDPLKLFVNRCKISFSPDIVAARDNISSAEVAARDLQKAEIVLRAALESCGAQTSPIRRKGTESNSERNTADGRSSAVRESAAAIAPAARPSGSPSPILETLKTWLMAHFRLDVAPDDEILAKIGAYIPDQEALVRFQRQAKNARVSKWAAFVTIARRCAEKREADEKMTPLTAAERNRRTDEIMSRGAPIAPDDLKWLLEHYPEETRESLEQIAAAQTQGAAG